MENLIETLVNAVAFLMAMRIAVLIGVILVVIRIGYSLIHSQQFRRHTQQFKRLWHKKADVRYRNVIRHRLINDHK
jgi:hypothetical protein